MLTQQQQQAQETSYRLAHEWYQGIDLDCSGVHLGQAMTYEIMRIAGVIFRRHMERGKGDGRTEEARHGT